MAEKWLIVKSFWGMSADYRDAESALPGEGCFILVRYYLLCHSLELCFKAFLADKGKTIKELRSGKFGHDLEALLEGCVTDGIGAIYKDITGLRQVVKSVNTYYSVKQFEYSEIARYWHIPPIETLRKTVKGLTHATKPLWIEPELRQANKS